MSNELSNVRPGYLASLPPDAVDNSDLNMFSKPPRIKVVQPLTGPPVKPPHKEGDIIVIPQLTKIGDAETPFTFVPVHFFPSWICLNPLDLKGQLKSIREYSLDPDSDVAKKCKSFVKERCPEAPEYILKYSETLNFMIIVEDNPEWSEIPIHLFFSRGEYANGQKFIGMLQARKAPRYACRFRSASGVHINKKGQSWYGLDIENDPLPWVDENNFHRYKKFYEDLQKLVTSRTIDLNLDDVGEEDTPDAATKSEF